MTIESLAESFREVKPKSGHPARIKYPKKLKDAAIEYFKANPSRPNQDGIQNWDLYKLRRQVVQERQTG